ncbi:MAG: gliding motility protein GldC [Bacteroides sp.]|nr:MAG: gliding motility protein GldC [Bacteroides sp.]
MKKAKIDIQIILDELKIPNKILWSATDYNKEQLEKSKAMFLYLWDEKQKNAFNINIWTNDMTIQEMKNFFYQILITMADTFENATNEKDISDDLRDYCKYFLKKMTPNK